MQKCGVDGCGKAAKVRGYCETCYQRLMRQGELRPERVVIGEPAGPDCLICGRPLREHGLTEWCIYELPRPVAPHPRLRTDLLDTAI